MVFNVMCKEKCAVKCPTRLVDKIHVSPKTNCKFLFSSSKIGKPLWKQARALDDFTFYDPENRENSGEYNALRDPFLKPFFLRKANLIHLRKNNFITDRNEVICSGIKEFNGYRNLLHRLKTEKRCEQRKFQATEDLDNHRVKLSDGVFEKIDKKSQKFLETYGDNKIRCCTSNPLRHACVVEIMKRRKLDQECEKMKKFKAKVQNYKLRLCEIQQLQHLKRNNIKERAFYQCLDIENKRTFVEEKLKRFQVKTRKLIAKKDEKIREKMAQKRHDRPKKRCLIVRCPIGV